MPHLEVGLVKFGLVSVLSRAGVLCFGVDDALLRYHKNKSADAFWVVNA